MARQLHGRLTDEQVVAILSRYVRREMGADQAMSMLELGRSQFFEWVKKYKNGLSSGFSTGYSRKTPNYRIGNTLEKHILDELKIEKKLINDHILPTTNSTSRSFLQRRRTLIICLLSNNIKKCGSLIVLVQSRGGRIERIAR